MEAQDLVVELLVDCRCELGEGPVWEAENNRLLWLDINKGTVHSWHSLTNRHTMHEFPSKISAITRNQFGKYIAASKRGFVELDFANHTVYPIADPESDKPNNRFNDGKSDALGRFWAGSMDEVYGKEGEGKLYMLNLDGKIEVKIDNVTCSNGLVWNKSNTLFYYIDSLKYNVVVFNFDLESGSLSDPRVLINFPKELGLPDGMSIDSNGNLWVAIWGSGKIFKIDSIEGKILREIEVPASQVTSCTFGGQDNKDLFITTASVGLNEDELKRTPYAGSLFRIRNIY